MAEAPHLLLLCGGRSSEHEISVFSARSILRAVDRSRYRVTVVGISRRGHWYWLADDDPLLTSDEAMAVDDAAGRPRARLLDESRELAIDGKDHRPVDIVFPALHGPYGEDGTIQGRLELANLPVVGCGTAASAVGMDKDLSRALFASRGLAQVDYRVITHAEWQQQRDASLERVAAALPGPWFVKPCSMGSSIGISRADEPAGLADAIDKAFAFDHKVMIEQAVDQPREIECAVLGNDTAEASVVGEIGLDGGFYDYQTKYFSDRARLEIPANLDAATASEVQRLAIAAFHAIGGSGLSRVDFLLDQGGKIYLNEINTMPGFTRISMYPLLWKASGLAYADLIDRLIALALERHGQRQQLSADRERTG